MGLLKKEKLLLDREVIHSLQGRIRVSCKALSYLGDYTEALEKNLNSVSYIKSCKFSPLTKNILVFYDHQQVSAEDVLEVLDSVISSYSLVAYKRHRKQVNNQLTVKERRLQEEPLGNIAKRMLLNGAAIAYSLFLKNAAGTTAPNTMLQPFRCRFTCVPALASLFLSIPIFKSGLTSLVQTKRPNADTLTMSAIVTSLVTGRSGSALTTILLSDIAELMTTYTMNRTRKAINNILSVGEDYVWKKTAQGQLEKVRIAEVEKNDQLVVHTGEKISVDGVLESGEGVIDQASITGEFMPVIRKPGEYVFAGTIVKSGTLTVRAEKVGDQTTVARIISLVEDAENNKAQIQLYADKLSAQLIPLHFALATLVYLTTRSVTRALNMLIIDYSCGIRLSTATALSAAIHTAAQNGVLIKGGNYLEALAESDTLILDKTGTLTEGKPRIVSIAPSQTGIEERELVELAAAAEETSTHPLAVAVLGKIRREGWRIPFHGETKVHVGLGVETAVEGKPVRVGNRKFLEDNGIVVSYLDETVNHLLARGESVIYVAYGEDFLGVLGVQDTLRENMKKALNRLRYLGIDDTILLTGDLEQQAKIVAKRMAMDRFQSEMLPDDKAKAVLQMQSKGAKVVMVGDGINDAPALAYADVGIAIGNTRTDIAVEAADVTITSDDPLLIPGVVNLSRRTMDTVRQNFAATIGINTLCLILGSTGVLPVFWGSVFHNLSTIVVVANSTRLLFYDFERR